MSSQQSIDHGGVYTHRNKTSTATLAEEDLTTVIIIRGLLIFNPLKVGGDFKGRSESKVNNKKTEGVHNDRTHEP
jgi:hypothetical protein